MGCNSGPSAASTAMMSSATIMAVSNARRVEEQNRKRRKMNQGRDQLYYKVNEDLNTLGKKIADIVGWEYSPNKGLHLSYKQEFRFGLGVGMGLLAWAVAGITVAWADSISGYFIPITLGIITLMYTGNIKKSDDTFEEIIQIAQDKHDPKKSTLLLYVYDLDGYRNWDEKEIDEIEQAIGVKAETKND